MDFRKLENSVKIYSSNGSTVFSITMKSDRARDKFNAFTSKSSTLISKQLLAQKNGEPILSNIMPFLQAIRLLA